jgi:glycosyltransferase involved in cell wall biosynthesis
MGAIPITSRFQNSGLVETVGEYDLADEGLSKYPPVEESEASLRLWTRSVIESSRADVSQLRFDMKSWARKQYSWATIAEQWRQEFDL